MPSRIEGYLVRVPKYRVTKVSLHLKQEEFEDEK